MKGAVLSIIMLSISTSIEAQRQLKKIWESDSVTLKGPESVLYDQRSNSLYVSNMNAGTVVRMNVDGKFTQKNWVSGLNSNKGSAIFKGMFYTAEKSGVAVIDIAKATVVKRIPVEGAVMLNDLAIDQKGIIYVTDTRAGKLYRIENEKSSLLLDSLPGANGLLMVKKYLYVATATSFLKVDADRKVTTIADGFEPGLDGIVQLSRNEFVLSNYKGILYYVKNDGSKEVLLDSRANKIMSNDIGYNPKTKTLFVPSFGTNQIIAYQIK